MKKITKKLNDIIAKDVEKVEEGKVNWDKEFIFYSILFLAMAMFDKIGLDSNISSLLIDFVCIGFVTISLIKRKHINNKRSCVRIFAYSFCGYFGLKTVFDLIFKLVHISNSIIRILLAGLMIFLFIKAIIQIKVSDK